MTPVASELVANMNQRSAELASFRVLMIERGHVDGQSLKGSTEFDADISRHVVLTEDAKVVRRHRIAFGVTLLPGQHDRDARKPAIATTI